MFRSTPKYALCSLLLLLVVTAVAMARTGEPETTTSRADCDREICWGVCCCKREPTTADNHESIYGNCTHLNLTAVPAKIHRDMTILDLGFNSLGNLAPGCFKNLPHIRDLSLISNKISVLDPDVFEGMESLQFLILQVNDFKTFPTEAFRHVSHSLKSLFIDDNYITDLADDALATLPEIHRLSLESNLLTRIPEGALGRCPKLQRLLLANNGIDTLHPRAFINNTNLDILNLAQNRISYIPDHTFYGLHKLKQLHLNNNPISSFGTKAFTNLSSLGVLAISDAKELQEFPDLNGTHNLQKITLNRCNIKRIPDSFCLHMTRLSKIDFHSNQISRIPDLSGCTSLQIIDLKVNRISSLKGRRFFSLMYLMDLTLKSNQITEIPEDAFSELFSLNYLDLSDNKIKWIHPDAFKSLQKLEHLNLVGNVFPTMPHAGLTGLQTLQTTENEYLQDIPPPHELPNIRRVVTSYGYHCCLYLGLENVQPPDVTEVINWLSDDPLPESPLDDSVYGNASYEWGFFMPGSDVDGATDGTSSNYEFYYSDIHDGKPRYIYEGSAMMPVQPAYNVSCEPHPGPFLPCKDLFGSWFLRISVWFVFLLAIFGNATVIIVIFLSNSKMDVPRFLICNLASADLAMGLYLSILASKDTASLGIFRQHAVEWQLGSGCRVAGFLAVFSSELSIYTLTTITLERFYAIKHAMHLEKRLKLRRAIIIMAIGWIFAITLATLPLLRFGINHFRYAVCLPVKVDDTKSLVYVATIMILNGLAFVIILLCYTSIYCSIQGSHAWNSNDSRVARRMSLLVFTDFVCWAPFAIFALASAFGKNLIPLEGSKVLIVFVLPVNSCANPFLYTLLTKQFKKDCRMIWRRVAAHTFMRRRSLRSAATISIGRQAQASHTTQTVRTRFQPSTVSQEGILDNYNGITAGERTTTNEILESTTIQNNVSAHRPSFQYQLSADSFTHMLSPDMSMSDQDQSRRGSGSPLIDRLTNGKPATVKTVQPSWTRFSLRRKFSIPFLTGRRAEREKTVSMQNASCARDNQQNHAMRATGMHNACRRQWGEVVDRNNDSCLDVSTPLKEHRLYGNLNRNENNDHSESGSDAPSINKEVLCSGPTRDNVRECSYSCRSSIEEAEMCQLLKSGSPAESPQFDGCSEHPEVSTSLLPKSPAMGPANTIAEDRDDGFEDQREEIARGNSVGTHQFSENCARSIPKITIEHLSPSRSPRILNEDSQGEEENLKEDAESPEAMLQIAGKVEKRRVQAKESTV